MYSFSRRAALAGLVAVLFASHAARAQEPVLKIVYPFAAGGSGDTIARLMAEYLSKDLGRPAIVENKAGAGGRIGAQTVKQAPPDGNTLLLAAAAQFTLQPHVASDLGYDPFTDFSPVSRVVKFDQVLAVSAKVPARSIGDLSTWLKANPDKAAFGSPGVGTGAHLVGLEFGRTFGIDVRHAPYRGTPAALPDLLAGHLPIYVAAVAELMEHHKSGGIRILATAGESRWPSLPDVPTLKEGGINMTAPGWFGFYVAAKTPPAIRERLEKAIAAAASAAPVRGKIEALNFQPTDTSARDLDRVQRAEFAAWGEVVKTTGFKPE